MAAFPDLDRLTCLYGFGRAAHSPAYLYRPTHTEEIAELFDGARAHGFSIAPRGAGRSYGDAALNAGQVVLDLQRMRRVLAWDPAAGIITVEPGVTIEQLWHYTLEDGWWPPVVPGTMWPTLGGCLGMNIHGKNNYHTGPLGDHVLAFEALLPNGETVTCTPTRHADLFFSMIGGLGLLGVFTSITLQLKRLHSGDLDVEAWAAPNLETMLDNMEPLKDDSDYLVGWVDGTARGDGLGRGQIHRAHYQAPGADPRPAQTLSIDYQDLPNSLIGLVPKSLLPRLMRLGLNKLGVTVVNSAKYFSARHLSHHHHYRQSLVAFNFLLDYVPNWQYSYGPSGLFQYQSLIPLAAAHATLRSQLALTQQRGLPNYLGVLKRHRADRFLLSHAVDGYSLAMDFPVPGSQRGLQRLTELAHDLDHIVLEAGGRFYFAKDSTLTPQAAQRFLGEDTLARFHALKARCDPDNLLQTQLYRRLLAPGRPGPMAPAPARPRAEQAPMVAAPPRPAAIRNGAPASRGNGQPN